jgi:MFS transporter, DHA3 family, macrolide efflux protein
MTTVKTDPVEDRLYEVPASGTRTYIRLWISQWLACAAVSFTVFVISVNINTDFNSFWMICLAYAMFFLPFPILSPFAGAFVDRYGHRPALLISNIGTLANLGILAIVMATGTPGPLYAVCALSTSTILRTLQLAAIESVVPLLVPKRHYGRANGPRMLMTGTFVLAGPVLAYLLLKAFAPFTIVVVECLLVVIAIYVVFKIRLPRVRKPGGDAVKQSLGRDVVDAWRYLRVKRGLVTMVTFLGIVSGVLGALEVAASGTVLGFADEIGSLVVSTACWGGMVVATIAIVVWGVPRRLVSVGLLGTGVVFAAAIIMAALRPSVILMSIGGFVAMGSLALIMATFQTVMQRKVEPQYLGRAFSIKNTASTVFHIVGDLGTRTLGIAVFAGAAAANGNGVWGWKRGQGWDEVNSPILAVFIGQGPGRGWALILMVIGVGVGAVVAFLRFRSPELVRVEQDLPEVTPDDRRPQAPESSVPMGVIESAPASR